MPSWVAPISHAVGDVLSASDWNLNTVTNPDYLYGDAAWTNATMQNSWVGGTVAPGFMKVGNVVHLRGLTHGGTSGSACFTLPAGYRPSALQNFIVAMDLGSGLLQVTAAGLVEPVGSGTSFSLFCSFPVT